MGCFVAPSLRPSQVYCCLLWHSHSRSWAGSEFKCHSIHGYIYMQFGNINYCRFCICMKCPIFSETLMVLNLCYYLIVAMKSSADHEHVVITRLLNYIIIRAELLILCHCDGAPGA